MNTNDPAYLLGHSIGTAIGNALPVLFVLALAGVLLFLAIRWFWLWYWRVNTVVALLERMATSLEHLEGRAPAAAPVPPAVPAAPTASSWYDRLYDRLGGSVS